MTPTNPYIAGNPVGDSPAFIGRADVLREVARMLRSPNLHELARFGDVRGLTQAHWPTDRRPAKSGARSRQAFARAGGGLRL